MISLIVFSRLPTVIGKGVAYSSDDRAIEGIIPQETKPPYNDLEALPEPSLAMRDDRRKKSSLAIMFWVITSSMLTRQRAKALIDDAEEAIPVEWGKLFSL